MKRKSLNSDSYRRKKNLRTFVRWLLATIAIVAFLYVMNQPYFFIKEIKVIGNKSLQTQTVTEAVETHLSGLWLQSIPRRNMFFYGSDLLESKLRDEFPKIYDIDIDTHVSELDIVITERDAHSLWCVDKEYERLFDEECYFADQDGYWYARAPYFSDNVLTKIYLDPRVDSIVLGDRFLNNKSFHELFTFVRELKNDYGVHPQKIIYRPQGDVEMKITRLNNQIFTEPFSIWFNTKDPFEKIYRNLGIVFSQAQFIQQFQEQSQDLQSIDVRFQGRIFYKFNPAS